MISIDLAKHPSWDRCNMIKTLSGHLIKTQYIRFNFGSINWVCSFNEKYN